MTKFVRIDGASKPSDNGSWVAGEVAGCEFRDARLGKRLSSLLQKLGGNIGGTIPFACQDWANTKAAYLSVSSQFDVPMIEFGDDGFGHHEGDRQGRDGATRTRSGATMALKIKIKIMNTNTNTNTNAARVEAGGVRG